ncbi:hypothetical protein G5B40_00300 [Pikeienuella piscinae]|uniref:Uncharacterized protein n=1 Tax=Pikeienuella piscinae TaxID=2748098 RepID=A0A7L5BVW4_9RHOB|nr:hypothetical protein [Pikeienuella piscinae]QIE54014.1 hypothetical protein G5B40_00300 [Pikeienuella piscinae]
MDKAAAIDAIRASAKLALRADINRLMTTKFERRSHRVEALKRVKETETRLEAILASTATPEARGAAAKQAEDAVDAVVLEAVRLSLSTTASIDVRAAQIEAIHSHDAERRAEIAAIDRAPAPAQAAADMLEKAGKAMRALRTLASDPKKYFTLAEQYWNKAVLTMARKLRVGSLARLTLNVSERLLDAIDRNLALSANRVSAAAVGRFLGVVGAGLLVVNVVIRTVADSSRWATALAKSGLPVAASLALGAVITGEAMMTLAVAVHAAYATFWATSVTVVSSEIVTLSVAGTVVEGASVAAGATAGAPPVAAVILATGVVIALGVAITALVDFLIDTWFGGEIPPSMMVAMQQPMATTMARQMASPMFRSMSG